MNILKLLMAVLSGILMILVNFIGLQGRFMGASRSMDSRIVKNYAIGNTRELCISFRQQQ